MEEELICFFCEADKDLIIPEIGIAFGMAGNNYAFCKNCLKSMTAEEFWKKLFKELEYAWPPKLKKK